MSNAALLRVPSPPLFLSVARAREALTKATSMLEAKKVKDVAEAMRVWARAQKDGAETQRHAAEIVLRSERRLGELARVMPKTPPSEKHSRIKSAPRTKSAALDEIGITKQRAAEYEKIAAIPEDQFEALVVEAKDAAKELTTAAALRVANGGRVNAKFSSESVEWYTPKEYVDAARDLMGAIDLDPATSAKANEVVGAKRILTVDDDGLKREWRGRVWLNPPYAFIEGKSSAGVWGAKLREEFESKRTTEAVLLVNAVTDAAWFQPLFDFPICFTDHRIEFYTPAGQPRSPVSGNALVYYGPNLVGFANRFRAFGRVVRPA